MELKVSEVKLPAPITFNYEELKAELMQKAAEYASLVYTEDQVKMAKTDRANLNRLKKALNDERIRREKEYMEPFNMFKCQVAEIIRIIDTPLAAIDAQVKAFEDQQKEEKMLKIESFWNSIELPAAINLGQVLDQKWLNASVSMKSIQEAITERLYKIAEDIAVVRSLPSYAFEAEQVYLSTLDLARAVSEAHRLQEQAEKKAAWEAEQGQGNVIDRHDEPVDEYGRQWIGFQALLSVSEAKALGTWMKAMGIKYKAI